MKIVIAGGDAEAEYIIASFRTSGSDIIVINEDREVAQRLLRSCNLPIICGTPWRKYVLEQANAYDADVFIALNERDEDNFATCMIAKKVFNAKKCICVVHNPKNVDVFKQLGIDSAISSTYLLAESIRKESTQDNLVKMLSLDNNRLSVLEFTVMTKSEIANHKIRDIHFPNTMASIAAIKRGFDVIIPNGDVTLLPKDVLTIVCPPQNATPVSSFLSRINEALTNRFARIHSSKEQILNHVAQKVAEAAKQAETTKQTKVNPPKEEASPKAKEQSKEATSVVEKPSASVDTSLETPAEVEAPKVEEALPSMEEKMVKKPKEKRSSSTKPTKNQ